MSHFANPKRTERYTFGCRCPGKPHEEDWMDLRVELGAEETAALQRAPTGLLGRVRALSMLLTDWNLLRDDGTEAPATAEMVQSLWADVFSEDLDAWIAEHVRLTSLPNASGGRSPNGSSATASPTRAPRRRQSSTTSS